MKKKRNEFSLNVGISSILYIFIILCLVSFAVLSLSSAMSDYKLSKRVASNSTEYFDACNEAEDLLSTFDKTLSAIYETGVSRAGYFEQAGKTKSFAVPVNELQTLEIEINILYPEKQGGEFYEITMWKVETTGELEYDDSLKVFK